MWDYVVAWWKGKDRDGWGTYSCITVSPFACVRLILHIRGVGQHRALNESSNRWRGRWREWPAMYTPFYLRSSSSVFLITDQESGSLRSFRDWSALVVTRLSLIERSVSFEMINWSHSATIGSIILRFYFFFFLLYEGYIKSIPLSVMFTTLQMPYV